MSAVLLIISDGMYVYLYVCTFISLNHSFDPTLMSLNRICNICSIVSQRMSQIRNIKKKHRTTEFQSFYFVVLIIVLIFHPSQELDNLDIEMYNFNFNNNLFIVVIFSPRYPGSEL